MPYIAEYRAKGRETADLENPRLAPRSIRCLSVVSPPCLHRLPVVSQSFLRRLPAARATDQPANQSSGQQTNRPKFECGLWRVSALACPKDRRRTKPSISHSQLYVDLRFVAQSIRCLSVVFPPCLHRLRTISQPSVSSCGLYNPVLCMYRF